MAKPRVHEIASELGVSSKTAMLALRDMGESVKGPSSSIEPPVARRLRNVLEGLPPEPSPFAVLDDADGAAAVHEALLRGPQGLPEALDLLAGRAQSKQEDALAGYFDQGVLFFIPPESADAVIEAGETPATMGFHEVPARTGLTVLPKPGDINRWEITGWKVTRPELELFTMLLVATPDGAVRAGHEHPRTLTGSDDRWAGLGRRGRVLAGAFRTIPERPAPTPATRLQPGPARPRAGDGLVHVVTATRPPSDLPSHAEEHPQDASVPRSDPERHRTGRWPVRGHWRRQWYARAGEHKRIWIADHTAGEPDGELRDRTIVYVVRDRTQQDTDDR